MNPEIKKSLGVYYTPPKLAKILAANCQCFHDQNVLDPSCGEGSLLLAAQEIFPSNSRYVGCDKRRIANCIRNVKFQECDFFDYSLECKFSTILTNPPYVKAERCEKRARKWYDEYDERNISINKRSDLWSYFIIKSVAHLEHNGTLAAILPWSFFQADYARPIREWLLSNFEEIKVLVVSSAQFQDAEQKVVLLWLKSKGSLAKQITISYSCDFEKLEFLPLDKSAWLSGSCLHRVKEYDANVFFNSSNIAKISNFCDVKIGLVPGASKFFILSDEECEALGISNSKRTPIITSSKQINDLEIKKSYKENLKYLLIFLPEDRETFADYIKQGEFNEYNKRSHCQKRDCWFSIRLPQKYDAFFTYRVSSVPLLVMNKYPELYCTNSFHYLSFKPEVSYIVKRWMQISLLSAYSLLEIEDHAKIYGSNVLKIEPTSLKNTHFYYSKHPVNASVFKNISKKIQARDKIGAVIMASDLIFSAAKIPIKKRKDICKKLNELRCQRMGKQGYINFASIL